MYLFELPDSLPLLLQTFLLALLLCSLYLFLRGFLVLHSGVEHLLGVLAAHLLWLRLLLLLLFFLFLLLLLLLLLLLFLLLFLLLVLPLRREFW